MARRVTQTTERSSTSHPGNATDDRSAGSAVRSGASIRGGNGGRRRGLRACSRGWFACTEPPATPLSPVRAATREPDAVRPGHLESRMFGPYRFQFAPPDVPHGHGTDKPNGPVTAARHHTHPPYLGPCAGHRSGYEGPHEWCRLKPARHGPEVIGKKNGITSAFPRSLLRRRE